MDIQFITGTLSLLGFLFSVVVFATRWLAMSNLSFARDLSVPKDSAARGIFYSFTTGMTPWVKESTRTHIIGYLRGIVFHAGIFLGLATFMVSPWLENFGDGLRMTTAIIVGFGALMGLAGAILRLQERNLREISTLDDHFAVWLVSIFLATITLSLMSTTFLPMMYSVAFLMFVYAPLGKIKHCIYFYFGRLFFGIHIGRRGIVRGLEASHG